MSGDTLCNQSNPGGNPVTKVTNVEPVKERNPTERRTLASDKMNALNITRTRVTKIIFIIALQLVLVRTEYIVPEVNVAALKPKGFKASIPDSPGLSLFVFHGNINRNIGDGQIGTLNGEIEEATNDQWVYENSDVQLKVGDVIHYYVFVSIGSAGYLKDNLTFSVRELTSRDDINKCGTTITTYRGGRACAGKVIFQDEFDTLNEDIWQIEQKIPINNPEYPFVSYQRLRSVVSVHDGKLRVAPTLQQLQPGFDRDSIYSGTLDLLNGCTESADACYMSASGWSILPPIISGRVSSKAFAFRYGEVEIRAKLPQGDWLYPELLLEPFLNKYGHRDYSSGIIKIAAARGNVNLYQGTSSYGNELLYGGAVISSKCHDTFLGQKQLMGEKWGDQFHDYKIRWEPDRLTLFVDGSEWAVVQAEAGSLRSRLPVSCRARATNLDTGGNFTPFDTEFYLTLGVAAGGVATFKDDVYTTGGTAKPWTNKSSKAKLRFWENLTAWFATWNTQSVLIVDRIKVTAL